MSTVTLYELVNLIDENAHIEIVEHETKSVLVSGRVRGIMVPFTRLNDFVKLVYIDQIPDKHHLVVEI